MRRLIAAQRLFRPRGACRPFRACRGAQAVASPTAGPQPAQSASSPSTVRYAASMSVVPIAGKGRGVIATQPLAAGDTVLIEEPAASLLVSAVLSLNGQCFQSAQPHCSYCLAELPVDTSRAVSACSGCDAVYCSDEHRQQHALAHHSITCGYCPPSAAPQPLPDIEPAPPPVAVKFPIMASHLLTTTLIQMLLPATSTSASASPRPSLWDDIGRLCHAELDSALLSDDYRHIIDHLSRTLHRHPHLTTTHISLPTLSALLPPQLHARLVGLLHLNSHSLYDHPTAASAAPFATALFVHGALFNHSCAANVELRYPLRQAGGAGQGGGAGAERGSGRRVGVWVATRDVAAGEELCCTYTDVSVGVKQRRDYLEWAYGFVCQCERCKAESGD